VIVFTIITVLAHRERKQKKREGQLRAAVASSPISDPDTPTIGEDGIEKKFPLVDEEDVTPAFKQ